MGTMGPSQRRVRHARRTGEGRVEKRWRRVVKAEKKGRFGLVREGPVGISGSLGMVRLGVWGCTRNRGFGVGIPLGWCGLDIFIFWRVGCGWLRLWVFRMEGSVEVSKDHCAGLGLRRGFGIVVVVIWSWRYVGCDMIVGLQCLHCHATRREVQHGATTSICCA